MSQRRRKSIEMIVLMPDALAGARRFNYVR
jgi:hypothetical protein